MNQKIKNKILLCLGLFFIAYGIFAMDYSIYRNEPGWVFWICYGGMVIIGLGCLFKSSLLILGQLNIMIIPLIFWNIDFFSRLIFEKNFWGLTGYFFDEMTPAARFISLEHLFLAPLGFLALYSVKIPKISRAWIFSLSELGLLFILTRLLTGAKENVNCVFYSCLPFFPSDVWHPLRWFLILAPLALLTHWILKFIPWFKKANQNS